MLEKVDMKTKTLKTTATRSDAGFTAIEIAMVAAVIAILSLIALPLFRNRVDEAKVAAAQADLNALMKSEQIVKADIDAYARLEDLDNVQLFGYTASPPGGVDKEVPYFKYTQPSPVLSPDPTTRRDLNQAERLTLAGTNDLPVWRGPYIAFQRSVTLEDLQNNPTGIGQYLLRSPGGNEYSAIQNFGVGGSPRGNFGDDPESRIPIDPWGNPYMFFPPTGNAADPSNVNAFSSAVIYSLGPNGQPGDGSQAGNAAAYRREGTTTLGDAALGKGDDLMVEF